MNPASGASPQERPFWHRLIRLLTAVLALVALYNGVSGGFTLAALSETLFWAAVLLAMAAALPIAGDPGGAVLARRALLEGQKLEDMVRANRAARRENHPWIALFGLAAAITLALSLILSAFAASH